MKQIFAICDNNRELRDLFLNERVTTSFSLPKTNNFLYLDGLLDYSVALHFYVATNCRILI